MKGKTKGVFPEKRDSGII